MRLGDALGGYFKAADVADGRTFVFTIDGCKVEEFKSRKAPGTLESKPVLYFRESAKGLVCNATIIEQIKVDYGTDDTDQLIGQQLELFEVDTSGPQGPCKGIRARRPVE
jgi:hypothetical protein